MSNWKIVGKGTTRWIPRYSESFATLKNCDKMKGIVDAYRKCRVPSKGVKCIPKVDWDDKSKNNSSMEIL
jgi:hypothetical protein